MNNKNTMGLKRFFYSHLFWGSLFMYWFRVTTFRVADPLSLTQSKFLLWGLVICCTLLGIGLTCKLRRNHLSILVNIALPFELYTLYTYRSCLSQQILISLIAAVILSVAYIFIISTAKISSHRPRALIISKRIKHCLLGMRTITSCCLLLIVASVAAGTLFGVSLTKSSVSPAKEDDDSVWTIANNIDLVCRFSETKWYTLSSEEKTTAMQVIANIECRYLGLPHELTLITASLPGNTLASYDDRTHTIKIDIDHFEESPPEEIIDSICHEAYHAYQYRLCDAYDSMDDQYRSLIDFYDVAFYKQEFKNYSSGEDDFYAYYIQRCEMKARSYAKSAVEEYEYNINKHLGIDETTDNSANKTTD